jgi:glycosyltransferase involved in cell wall biosynthesis
MVVSARFESSARARDDREPARTAVSSPLRIVLALESSGPGGAENVVLRLAQALRERGDAPIVATLQPGWMTERAQAQDLPVWIVPQRSGVDLAWVARFAIRLRREQVDLLHTHEFAMNSFGGAAALLARIPAVSTIHGRHWVADRPRRALAYRMLRRLGIPIVPVSEDLAGFLVQGLSVPRAWLEVVHNGIPLPAEPAVDRARARAEAREALRIPADGQLVVAVGNLYPVKDHASLLRALASLPAARVAIAGRGAEEEPLRRLASELGIAERVHLLGLRDDVETVFAAGDVFAQPSLSEGLPLAVLEAMASGLPVVASRVGGIPEAVIEGETGFLTPPADPAALAAALARVLEAEDRGASLGAAGRARVAAEFSVEQMAARYRQLYVRLRGSRRAARSAS